MKNKCKHYYLNILRTLNLTHGTEVSVRYDEDDQYFETTVRSDWTNEWDLEDCSKIEIICSECKKSWSGRFKSDFPKWLQQVLCKEEYHFEKL